MYKKNANIVIIDDEIQVSELVKELLIATDENFKIEIFNDSSKFVEKIETYNNDNLDLILVDIMMPKYDGIQILEKLNSKRETQYIPKVVMSAYADNENLKTIYNFGAIMFIEKPFSNLAYFSNQIKNLLKIKLYDDYNRSLIDLLKQQNKKMFSNKEITEITFGDKINAIVNSLGDLNFSLENKFKEFINSEEQNILKNNILILKELMKILNSEK